jgi:Tol biopolymer transport system component
VTLILLSLLRCDCGTSPELVITDWDRAPSWSNRGDRLTFSSPGYGDSINTVALYVIDTNGQNRQLLAAGGLSSTWLPGDTAIVFFRPDFKLFYLSLVTMQESLLCDCSDARFPEVESTGRYLYYEDAGIADNWATSIYRMTLTSGETTHIVGGSYPSLSPDGRYLLVNRDHVYRVELMSGAQEAIFSSGLEYDWSPEGDTILIGRFYEKNLHDKMFKVTKDGRWSAYFANGESPKYSPNGNRIAVIRISSDAKEHIWLINRDGRNPKQITF